MKDAKGHGSDPRGAHAGGVNAVGKQPLPQATESPASSGLRLFGDNDSNLYRQSFTPVVNNLSKKMDKGIYDPAKAAKLWGHHADSAAQSYAKQAGDGRAWHQQFPTSVRREAAQHWERIVSKRIRNGEFK